jgi:2,3-dihydroxybenzoate decarboxylase
MKVIAIEEAFSMEGLKMVPRPDEWAIPIDSKIIETWVTRLRDFEEWRLPEMDVHEVTIQVLSLTAPGIQAVPDAPTAVANAKIVNDYLAAAVSKHNRDKRAPRNRRASERQTRQAHSCVAIIERKDR